MSDKQLVDMTGDDIPEILRAQNIAKLAELKATDRVGYERVLMAWRKASPPVRNVGRIEREVDAEIKRAQRKNSDFILTSDGGVAARAQNVRIALDLMNVQLQYNLLTGMPEVVNEEGEVKTWSDHVLDDLWIALDDRFDFFIPKDRFATVVSQTARTNAYHPIIEYLDTLEWDGKKRLDTWLIRHMGVADTPFTRAISELFMVAAVRRLREPGCKFDEMLLLCGVQGLNKSSIIKTLAIKQEWFSDSMPVQESEQRIIEATRGKWLMEISELRGGSKAEQETIKAQLSRQVDRARMAYGREVMEVPRQFVFFGTSNLRNPLSDLTGNRRFWVVWCDRMANLKEVEAERDQLWAEAIVQEELKMPVMLPPNLWPAAAEVQREHTRSNPLQDRLEHLIGDLDGFIATEDLWSLLEIGTTQRRAHSDMLMHALAEMGFKQARRRTERGRARGFARGDSRNRIVADMSFDNRLIAKLIEPGTEETTE